MTKVATDNQKKRFLNVEEALKNSDMNSLRSQYEKAEHDVSALVDGLEVIAGSQGVRNQPSNDVICAMRDVALAAINLARDVAIPTPAEKPMENQ